MDGVDGVDGVGVRVTTPVVDAAALASWWAEQDAALLAGADRDGLPQDPADDPTGAGAWAEDPAEDPSEKPAAGRVTPADLLDELIAVERRRGWVAAQVTRLLAAMAPDPVDTADRHWVRDEIACALRQAPAYVTLRLHVARELTTRLTDTLRALQTGRAPRRPRRRPPPRRATPHLRARPAARERPRRRGRDGRPLCRLRLDHLAQIMHTSPAHPGTP